MGRVEVVLAVGGVLALVALVVVVLLLRASRRRALVERQALEEGLRTSREQVEELARRVDELSHEVQGARRTSAAAAADREYVITTLAEVAQTTGADDATLQRPNAPVDVEERVVESLSRIDDGTAVGRRVVDLGSRCSRPPTACAARCVPSTSTVRPPRRTWPVAARVGCGVRSCARPSACCGAVKAQRPDHQLAEEDVA